MKRYGEKSLMIDRVCEDFIDSGDFADVTTGTIVKHCQSKYGVTVSESYVANNDFYKSLRRRSKTAFRRSSLQQQTVRRVDVTHDLVNSLAENIRGLMRSQQLVTQCIPDEQADMDDILILVKDYSERVAAKAYAKQELELIGLG